MIKILLMLAMATTIVFALFVLVLVKIPPLIIGNIGKWLWKTMMWLDSLLNKESVRLSIIFDTLLLKIRELNSKRISSR